MQIWNRDKDMKCSPAMHTTICFGHEKVIDTYAQSTHSKNNIICRIPDDCIDEKRYPLFMARAVLSELIESLQSTRSLSS